MDIFYIDESNDKNFYVATAIAIPFLRPRNGQWHIVWPDYLQQIYDHLPTHLHSRPNGAGNDGIIWLAEDQRSQT